MSPSRPSASHYGQDSTRPKIPACAECKRLKIKCDRIFPCSQCSKRGLATICPDQVLRNDSRRVKLASDTQELHERIAILEEALQAATEDRYRLTNQAIVSGQPRPDRPGPSKRQRTREGNESSTFGHLKIEGEYEKSRYFGAASSFYLSRHVTNPRSTLPSGATLDISGLFASTPTRRLPQELDSIILLHLPPPEVIEMLADAYFETFGWYTIIVQRSDWDSDLYPHLATASNPQKVGLVFLVLALGSVKDLSSSDSVNMGHQLFAAAKQCLALDGTPSITLVRCVFLYGTAIMNGGDETAGGDVFWPILRLAMSICEELGLHRNGRYWDLSEEETTRRAIVFWEIHGYDVLQSIALGRGQCIADYAIDCPLPTGGSDIGFSCQTFELTRIWSRINDRQIRVKPSVYNEVVQLDQALRDFEARIPEFLVPRQASLTELTNKDGQKTVFQSNMLSLFINEARLALHRGAFARTLKDFPLEPQDSPQRLSYVSCLEASRTIILVVRNMLAAHGQMIHRRWHFFFHLFSACVCLAAAAIRAPCSSLAKIVVSELEMGVGLFKMTKRRELVTIEKLRDCAARAVEAGGSIQNGASRDNEDLELLGDRASIIRRRGEELPPFTSSRLWEQVNTQLDATPPTYDFHGDSLSQPDFDIDEFISMWCLAE